MIQTTTTQQRNKQATDAVNRPFYAAPDGSLAIITRTAVIGIAVALHALSASAQTAKDVKGATPLVAIQDEPAVKLIVDPPIPEQLALGRVFIQYRTENLRIMPVFGKAALAVSPRVGHLHYYVDGQSWPIVDTSGETVVLVGLHLAHTKCCSNWLIQFTDRSQAPQNWWSSLCPILKASHD